MVFWILDHATGTSSNRNTGDVNWAMKNPAPLRFIGRALPTSTKYPFVISICQVNMDLAPPRWLMRCCTRYRRHNALPLSYNHIFSFFFFKYNTVSKQFNPTMENYLFVCNQTVIQQYNTKKMYRIKKRNYFYLSCKLINYLLFEYFTVHNAHLKTCV